MLSLLSEVSSDIIGTSGVISEIFFVKNSLTSRSPLLTGDLFSPKTSRHRLSDHLPPIAVPLSRLRMPAL